MALWSKNKDFDMENAGYSDKAMPGDTPNVPVSFFVSVCMTLQILAP